MGPEKLNSFPYREMIDGVEHNYRITQNNNRYGVERDGLVIAEVIYDKHWRQLSGKQLGKALQESIYKHIEAHLNQD